MKNKKGQEEIVGFVLIMVITAVVLLIFLGITLRKGSVNEIESVESYQFLESVMEYTSDCAVRFVPDYSRIGELFGECLEGRKCLDGRGSCEALNESVQSILEKSWKVDNESIIKGYELDAIYTNGDEKEEIIVIKKGVCLNRLSGATYLIPSFPGSIGVSFVICTD